MKKITLSILTVALMANIAGAQKLDRSIRPKPGPAPEIRLGKSESFTLPNGMRVFVVENHKLPTVAFSIQLDIKPELEGDMAGYRELMSDLLTSGTKTRSNEKLNEEIDFIGARIAASDESIYAAGLKKHQEKILELMSDIAINADIKQSELDKIKKRALSGLETEENEPDAMLRNVGAAVNFGKNHPYGEVPTKETMENVTLEKVRGYYSTYFRPNVAYMAIVGDVTVKEIKPLIEKYFGKWQKANVPVASYSNPQTPKATNVAFVPREAAVQSVIDVTYPVDLQPGSPEVIQAKVANSILGGGSNGRLFLNLREQHGWTYGSYSSIRQDDLKGAFSAYAKCRNEVTDSSVAEIVSEMNRMRNEPVPGDVLQNHITHMSGSFAIGLENPQTVAQYAINIERYNMPKDYYQNYLKNLSKVTAADVQAMAKKYIHPENAHIVVVGSKDDVAKKMVRFDEDGKLAYYNNYGEPIEVSANAAVPAGVTAERIMQNYLAAIGGEKALNGIKDIKTVSKGQLSANGQNIPLTVTEVKKAPGKLKSVVEGMGMVLNQQVFDGTKGYMVQQGQRAEMDADMIAAAKQEADIQADLHPEKYGIKRSVKGMDKVDGADVYAVAVTDAEGKTSTEYYDVKTGLLVKEVKTEEVPGAGAVTFMTEYSDYKEVPGAGGYKMPYTITQSGPFTITAKVESVEVNKGIADTEFN